MKLHYKLRVKWWCLSEISHCMRIEWEGYIVFVTLFYHGIHNLNINCHQKINSTFYHLLYMYILQRELKV